MTENEGGEIVKAAAERFVSIDEFEKMRQLYLESITPYVKAITRITERFSTPSCVLRSWQIVSWDNNIPAEAKECIESLEVNIGLIRNSIFGDEKWQIVKR